MKTSSEKERESFFSRPAGVLLLGFLGLLIFLFFFLFFSVLGQYKKIKQAGDVSSSAFTRSKMAALVPEQADKEKFLYPKQDLIQLGSPNAPFRIVLFADFLCPHSKTASFSLRELTLSNPEKINFIFRFFPLDESSLLLDKAAICAQKQNKFWPFHDRIFANQASLEKGFSDLDLKIYALQSGLEMSQFNKCLDDPSTLERLQIDFNDGQFLGVQGTPTYFINSQKVSGLISQENLKKILNELRK